MLIAGALIWAAGLIDAFWPTPTDGLAVFIMILRVGGWALALGLAGRLLWIIVELHASAKSGAQIPQVLVDAQGITIRKLLSREFFAWGDITDFYVMEFPQGDSASDYALIAFSKDQVIPESPKAQRKVAKLKLNFPGISSHNQDKYRVLCRWLNLWRSWAINGVNAPSLAQLESILDDMKIKVLPPTP